MLELGLDAEFLGQHLGQFDFEADNFMRILRVGKNIRAAPFRVAAPDERAALADRVQRVCRRPSRGGDQTAQNSQRQPAVPTRIAVHEHSFDAQFLIRLYMVRYSVLSNSRCLHKRRWCSVFRR